MSTTTRRKWQQSCSRCPTAARVPCGAGSQATEAKAKKEWVLMSLKQAMESMLLADLDKEDTLKLNTTLNIGPK